MTVPTLAHHGTLLKSDGNGTFDPAIGSAPVTPPSAELAFWQDRAARLDPAAYALFATADQVVGPVPAGKRWYALNYWQVKSPTFARTDAGVTLTAGSPTITDASMTVADAGLWLAGPGISSGRQLIAAAAGSGTMAANPTFPAKPTAAAGTAGVLTGAYKYVLTFTGPYGESLPGTASTVVNPSAQQVNLTGLSAGPSGSTARTLYRTQAGGSTFTQVAVINDNTTTTYTDNATDASIVGNPAPPTSISVQLYSYLYFRECDAEHALMLPAGASLTIAPDGGFVYVCQPELVIPAPYGTGTDQRYLTDPKALYYSRLQTLQGLTPFYLDAIVAPGSPRGTAVLPSFPTDFTNGFVVAFHCTDSAWVGLTGGISAINLAEEVSDDHQQRRAAATLVPFVRTTFPKIQVQGGNNLGDAQTPTGGGYGAASTPTTCQGGVTYYKLPVGW